MEHCASTIELRGFTLIACAFGEIIKSFLARHFQTNSFESWVHKALVGSLDHFLRACLFGRLALAGALLRSCLFRIQIYSDFIAQRARSHAANDSLGSVSRSDS